MKGMAFENTKELGLTVHGHFADFVEEQRPQIGLLKVADMIAVGGQMNEPALWPKSLTFPSGRREWRRN